MMGSLIEFNDTLQITTEQGFPEELQLKEHQKRPFTAKDFKDRIFKFNKPGTRIYHALPTRVFLVHNIGGKWLYWGHAHIIEQTINSQTSGKFKIVKIYDPDYQKLITINESRDGCSYFSD